MNDWLDRLKIEIDKAKNISLDYFTKLNQSKDNVKLQNENFIAKPPSPDSYLSSLKIIHDTNLLIAEVEQYYNKQKDIK